MPLDSLESSHCTLIVLFEHFLKICRNYTVLRKIQSRCVIFLVFEAKLFQRSLDYCLIVYIGPNEVLYLASK